MRHGRGVADTLTAVTSTWSTPMAGTPAQNGNAAAGNSDFSRKAEELAQELWMTPDVPNGGRALPKGTSATGKRPDGAKAQVGLNNQVAMWTTPQAHDVTPRGSGQKPTAAAGNACLATDAQNWPSPQARDFRSGDSPDSPRQARKAETGWSQNLNDVAEMGSWPTPASRDHKGENSPAHLENGTGRLHLDQLPNAVAFLFSRPAPETQPHGGMSSDPRLTWRRLRRLVISTHGRGVWRRMAASGGKRRLNPNFVAWLMGWPIGHPSCASSATEWCRYQQDMRGALSLLPMASGPWIWKPPQAAATPQMVQGDLFGGL